MARGRSTRTAKTLRTSGSSAASGAGVITPAHDERHDKRRTSRRGNGHHLEVSRRRRRWLRCRVASSFDAKTWPDRQGALRRLECQGAAGQAVQFRWKHVRSAGGGVFGPLLALWRIAAGRHEGWNVWIECPCAGTNDGMTELHFVTGFEFQQARGRGSGHAFGELLTNGAVEISYEGQVISPTYPPQCWSRSR
jgi:hypothetical protein